MIMRCRRSSVVELQLPKLIMRVRFPSLAPLELSIADTNVLAIFSLYRVNTAM